MNRRRPVSLKDQVLQLTAWKLAILKTCYMKLDLAKTLKAFYTAPSAPQRITVPEARFLTISGTGDPNGPAFAEATTALYTAAYSIKMLYKKQQQDFVVCKLEGLWWVDEKYLLKDLRDALQVPREEWRWQLLVRMPDFVTQASAEQAIKDAFKKKRLALLNDVSLISYEEGDSVQVMHTGPYSEEPATLQRLHGFIQEHHLQPTGKHHEIYLSDPRKVAPEKMKTILRQAVK